MSQQFPKITDQLPEDPMIRIHIDALGVLCFNEEDNRAEIGFLKVREHILLISMWDSKCNQIIESGTVLEARTLKLTSSVAKEIVECYQKDNARENFSHIFDLTRLYKDQADFKDGLDFLATFYIQNAVLSTHPESLFRAVPFEHGNSTNRLEDLNVGQTLSIFTKNRNAEFYIGADRIELDPNESYTVVIRNGGCRVINTEDSDFQYFYDLFREPGSIRYNLKSLETDTGWIADCEIKEFEELGKQLSQYFSMKMKLTITESERSQLRSRLEYLLETLCPPVACLLATLPKVPRKLPRRAKV